MAKEFASNKGLDDNKISNYEPYAAANKKMDNFDETQESDRNVKVTRDIEPYCGVNKEIWNVDERWSDTRKIATVNSQSKVDCILRSEVVI